MTVHQLREMLEELDGDMKVVFLSQPNWPFIYSISNAVTSEELGIEAEQPYVILAEGQQLRYATSEEKDAWGGY